MGGFSSNPTTSFFEILESNYFPFKTAKSYIDLPRIPWLTIKKRFSTLIGFARLKIWVATICKYSG
jgi:hypothetical protein